MATVKAASRHLLLAEILLGTLLCGVGAVKYHGFQLSPYDLDLRSSFAFAWLLPTAIGC